MYESFLYKKGRDLQTDLTPQQITEALMDKNSLLWVDIKEAKDDDIDLLTNTFKLHPLTVEDSIMPNARTKLESFQHYLFLNMFADIPQGIALQDRTDFKNFFDFFL